MQQLMDDFHKKFEIIDKRTEQLQDQTDARFDAFAKLLLANTKKKKKKNSDDESSSGDESDFKQSMIDDRGIKLEDFTGLGSPEDFLEWERQVEKISDYKGFDDTQRFKIAYIRLTKNAGIWFESLKARRTRAGKKKISTWTDLKRKLRAKYLPDDFEQIQYLKLTTLTQDTLSVNEYIAEFDRLTTMCDLNEKEPMRIARFIKGLHRPIARKIELNTYSSFNDVCKLALKIENHWNEDKKGGPYASKGAGSSKPKSSHDTNSSSYKGFDSNKDTTKIEEKKSSEKPKLFVPHEEYESRRRCFKCQGKGHIASECPNRKALTIKQYYEWEEDEKHMIILPESDKEKESFSEEEAEDVFAEDGGQMLVVRQVLHAELIPTVDQRESLFHTRCKIGDTTCRVIVDSGSCTNVASTEMVSKLNLPTRDRATPYKLSWLDDSKGLRVKKQALVNFSIGNYKEELWCDVVPMSVCHILLGRPWQYDRKVKHDGETNVYTVKVGNQKIRLQPLSPKT